jgi:micrococcal nuclease
MRAIPTLLILFVVFLRPCVAGAEDFVGDTAMVTAVESGDVLALDDGRRVRLAAIETPRRPLGRPAETRWRRTEEAIAGLRELALGRKIALRHVAGATDRYGRIVAQLYRADGLWLQGELLRRGLARVSSTAETRALVLQMLALEAEARIAGRGVWRDPVYAVRRPDETGRFIESFQLVEGTVVTARKTKGQIYLDFGADQRTAFALRISRGALPLFAAARSDPSTMAGKRARVRGWLIWDRRPMIEVTHPEQIEILSPG